MKIYDVVGHITIIFEAQLLDRWPQSPASIGLHTKFKSVLKRYRSKPFRILLNLSDKTLRDPDGIRGKAIVAAWR
jgi:hypothetical protein